MSWRAIMGLPESEPMTLLPELAIVKKVRSGGSFENCEEEVTDPKHKIPVAEQWISMTVEGNPGPLKRSTVKTLNQYREQMAVYMDYPPPFPPEALADMEKVEAYGLWWGAVKRLHRWGLVAATGSGLT